MKKVILALAIWLCAASAFSQSQLNPGIQEFIFNANATAAPITGTAYSVPNQVTLLTWIITFASAPASQTTLLECSNDNAAWATCDTSTAVAGEVRNLYTAARFVRASETARSGGGAITVTIIGKNSANPSLSFSSLSTTGDISSGTRFLAANGTAGAPSFSWTGSPTVGMYNGGGFPMFSVGGIGRYYIATNTAGYSSSVTQTWSPSNVDPTITPDTGINRASAGVLAFSNNGAIGSTINVASLPTVGSGFGTSPFIVPGSTPFAGEVGVGSGGIATSGIVLFGTSFPQVPFCTVTNVLSNVIVRVNPTVSQLAIAASAAWTSGDFVNWICVSPK